MPFVEANTPFIERFFSRSLQLSNLCVGIDPSAQLLHSWNLPDSASGLGMFCAAMFDAVHDLVSVVKPQVAFFERHGPRGLEVLQDFIAQCRSVGLLTIADAKRGDIGTTVEAYADAWLGSDSTFGADALTVHAYLGVEALEPMIKRAHAASAYIFVVARSSNSEGNTLQLCGAPPLWIDICQKTQKLSDAISGRNSSVAGAVVGATHPEALIEGGAIMPTALLLAPGIGIQGASLKNMRKFGSITHRILPSASRSIAQHGPTVSAVREAVHAARFELLRDD